MMGPAIRRRPCAAPVLAFAILVLPSLSLAQTTVLYVHTDALGSPVAATDAYGQVVEESAYDPFGSNLNPVSGNQPSFTGHVSDEETGLSYMQQRYYDPVLGVFMSVDPIGTYGSPITQFNRYRYANNNPYSFVDPDGRVVNYAYVNGITQHAGRMHMAAVAMSPSARDELRRLEESPRVYTIVISGTGLPSYNPNNRTIYLNPNIALLTKEKQEIQPPEVNSSHEISHGAEHDRSGDEKFAKALLDVDENGTSPEENRANSFEKKVGDELEVPTRESYKDVERVIDCKKTPMTGC